MVTLEINRNACFLTKLYSMSIDEIHNSILVVKPYSRVWSIHFGLTFILNFTLIL